MDLPFAITPKPMEPITLINGRQKTVCTNPVYYARSSGEQSKSLVPSHIIAWPQVAGALDKVSFVQLKTMQMPVIVDVQADGSVWLGGAYLDTIAKEFGLTPLTIPDEIRGKSEAWLKAVDESWQTCGCAKPETTGSKPAPGWNGYSDADGQNGQRETIE